jgi:hypothetical protein
MPDRENLTIFNAFHGDENCFVWIQLSGDKMKISFKFSRSDLPGKCIQRIQKKEGYTLVKYITPKSRISSAFGMGTRYLKYTLKSSPNN